MKPLRTLGIVALVFTVGALLFWQLQPASQPLELPALAIDATAPAGRALLRDGEGLADYPGLTTAFQVQEHGSWCGVASSVAVLNARGASLTQSGFFTPKATAVRAKWQVNTRGMTLGDLAGMLRAHGALVQVHYAKDTTEQQFRKAIASNLSQAGDWLIVNYDRRVMNEAGGGHMSPLAAWDEDTDRVLLLDTAAYKYPPHWVPVTTLFAAMQSVDADSGRSRGWVVVR